MSKSMLRGMLQGCRRGIVPVVLSVLVAGGVASSAHGQGRGAERAGEAARQQAVQPGDARPGQAARRLMLRTGEVETERATVGLEALVREAKGGARGRAVIQLDGPMTAARQAALEEAGVAVESYLPEHSYIVRLGGADEARVRGLGFVRWQGRYEREWKLDPEIGLRPYSTPERQDETRRGVVTVSVHLFPGEPVEEVVGAVLALPGAEVLGIDDARGEPIVTASMRFADSVLLSDIPEVQFVEDAPENTLRSNTNTRWIVQTNVLNMTPVYTNGIRGQGQIVGVIDSALDLNHCSFRDTPNTPGPGHRKVLAYNVAQGASSHGTHVSGTVAGDAGANDNTRGIAYEAKIVYNSIPSPQNETNIYSRLELHYNQGARVHTNSWGDDGSTAYTGQARGIDRHVYDYEDSLVLFAITNTSTLKTPENNKNGLAVAASGGSGSQQNHCSGGTGPTNDGRRKPEIYAPGCSTNSSSSGTSCGTTSFTGTSMACPAVAGTALLARQYFVDGYYPSGVATAADGFTPSAALLKATLLNSTVDMTGVTGYPSNLEGWGRVTLNNTLYFPGDPRTLWVRDVWNASGLTTGGVFEQGLTVLSGGEPLKITLAWTEPAAAVNANPAYINNLDLEVVGPGGVLYYGNNFSGGQSAAGGSPDFRNNVEMVLVNAPTPGPWIVRVRAAAVNQGGTQGYALAATGDITSGPRPLSVSVSGVPSLVAPGVGVSFLVTVSEGDDALVPGSPTLFYRSMAAGPFTSAPLADLGGNVFQASLPPFYCEDTPQFYVSAAGVDTGTVFSPADGAANPMSFQIGEVVTLFDDDMETDQGWTVGAPTDTATTGIWERVDPIGTAYQPEDDHTPDPGVLCWITGQHTPGQGAGFNDVDNGATTLTSPLIDLSGSTNPVISYWRWFFGASDDRFTVSISNDGGSTWTLVEELIGGNGGWLNYSFQPAGLLPLTSQMRLRFVCADLGVGTFCEGGLDDVLIQSAECVNPPPPSCPGDANGDLMVDFEDISAVLSHWGQSGPMGDANGDQEVNFEDLTEVLANFGTDCTESVRAGRTVNPSPLTAPGVVVPGP